MFELPLQLLDGGHVRGQLVIPHVLLLLKLLFVDLDVFLEFGGLDPDLLTVGGNPLVLLFEPDDNLPEPCPLSLHLTQLLVELLQLLLLTLHLKLELDVFEGLPDRGGFVGLLLLGWLNRYLLLWGS